MANRFIQVPVSRLLDAHELASTKVLWMALRLNPTATPAELETLTGLSRHTVQSALVRAKASHRAQGGPKVKVPGALLAERSVGAQAKVLYGLLQAPPHFQDQSGQFTYASLSSQTHLSPNALKRAMAELVQAGWAQVTQASRLSPIHFTLGGPEAQRSQREALAAEQRLRRAKYVGEAIMHEYLSLLIESDEFTDNARPGFLVNPLTGERLELDRFYPPGLVFEFHGAQHFRSGGEFSQAQVEAQQLRDLIKAGICLYRGIHLVIIQAEDLSLQGMIKRIGEDLPLRDLAGHEPLIDLLEEAGIAYQAAARTRGDEVITPS